MSESHRRLVEIGPSPDATGRESSPLPADLRKLKGWVSDLPWANPDVTLSQLSAALVDLSGRSNVSGADRLAAADSLRGPVKDVAALVSRRFLGVPLPLPASGVAAARRVEAIHRVLADVYRRCAGELCGPSGKLPLLRSGRVVGALERACFHYASALQVAWATYRDPAEGAWLGLYRTHHFAEAVGVAEKVPSDPSSDEARTARAHLVRTLLVALANPYAFDQDDQSLLWRLAGDYVQHCQLKPAGGADATNEDGDQAPVPVDSDRGPGGLVDDPAQWLVLEFAEYRRDVAQAISQAEDPASVVSIGRGRVLHDVPVAMLVQLGRAFGQRSARRHERLPGDHALEVVIGLAGLHFHLSGRDFDEFVRQAREHVIQISDRAGWAQSGADAARAPLVPAIVLDQSLGGYRLNVRDETLVRARVGELVGLSWRQDPGDAAQLRDWLVGVVRWLRYNDEGGVVVGVELLSRRAVPVALQRADGQGDTQPAVRAVELVPFGEQSGGVPQFVVSVADRPDGAMRRLSIAVDHDEIEATLVARARTGEYLVLGGAAALQPSAGVPAA